MLKGLLMLTVRPYESRDEASWLVCRTLSFLHTSYYDDVKQVKTTFDGPALELVALDAGILVGVIDLEVQEDTATIDTIAVHPDAARQGVGRTLLDRAVSLLPSTVHTVEAWTRDDPAANEWYLACGFTADRHYLHVYKGDEDSNEGFETPHGLSSPVTAFMHATLDYEAEMRRRFRRVHVCRRYSKTLSLP